MAAAWLGLAFHDQWDPEDTAWVNECLVIAESEVRRACRRGLPASIDRSDIQSYAHEVIALNYRQIRDGALMRERIKSRVLDLVRRELRRICVCKCEECRNSQCGNCTNESCRSRSCAFAGCSWAYGILVGEMEPSAGPVIQVNSFGPRDPEDGGSGGGRSYHLVDGLSDLRLDWQAIEKAITPEDYAILEAVLEYGYSQADVARQLKVTRVTVHKRLKRIARTIRDRAPEAYTRITSANGG